MAHFEIHRKGICIACVSGDIYQAKAWTRYKRGDELIRYDLYRVDHDEPALVWFIPPGNWDIPRGE